MLQCGFQIDFPGKLLLTFAAFAFPKLRITFGNEFIFLRIPIELIRSPSRQSMQTLKRIVFSCHRKNATTIFTENFTPGNSEQNIAMRNSNKRRRRQSNEKELGER